MSEKQVANPIESVLEKKFNPETWQWMQKGKIYKIDSLSREDLMQIACECMTVLARFESLQMDMAALCNQWQNGEVKPDEDDSDD